jgi:hypothetical protein
LADAADLKSAGAILVGSSPTPGTIRNCLTLSWNPAEMAHPPILTNLIPTLHLYCVRMDSHILNSGDLLDTHKN